MAEKTSRTFICSCNNSMALPAASEALDAALSSHDIERATQLCRREVIKINAALEGTQDILVACTQEAPLFTELASAKQTIAPIRFVNIREHAGWGDQKAQDQISAQAKMAALLEMASKDFIDPVPGVSYQSAGRVLVLGSGQHAADWAERLHKLGQNLPDTQIAVTLLLTGSTKSLKLGQQARPYPVVTGELLSIKGWLGNFEARWSQQNPIDLDSCVRCGACVEACPSQAISWDFQVNLDQCDNQRACVKACGAIGAIDFDRGEKERSAEFDLVLDLRDPLISSASTFTQFHPPQGYYRAGLDNAKVMQDALALMGQIGEFEKPKYFSYEPRICAHSRNKLQGCNQCIDVCSTKAIRSVGEKVEVEPHLCMGCGACATVCPSGAMSYQYPTTERVAQKMRRGIAVYRQLTGASSAANVKSPLIKGPTLLISDEKSRHFIDALTPSIKQGGLPSDCLPLFVQDTASVGMDLMLAAMAYGASRVLVFFGEDAAPQYVEASRFQAQVAEQILFGLLAPNAAPIPGEHHSESLLKILHGGTQTLHEALSPKASRTEKAGLTPNISTKLASLKPATFALPKEKRRAIELCVSHLQKQLDTISSKEQVTETKAITVALPAKSPFGHLSINAEKCTLCMACVGACPEGALLDGQQAGQDRPQLRLLEKNCVQCGLCEKTCPEQAIQLIPRWNFAAERDTQRVVNEAVPFHCVKCNKPFGTLMMIENMMSKLSGHSAFAGAAAERLKMCSDCRVVDMYSATSQASIHDVKRGQ